MLQLIFILNNSRIHCSMIIFRTEITLLDKVYVIGKQEVLQNLNSYKILSKTLNDVVFKL